MDAIFCRVDNVSMAKLPFDPRPAPSKKTAQPPRHYLKEWRDKRGLTQEQLADRIDVSRGLIAQYESSKTKIPESRIYALAQALDCDPGDLFRVNPEKEGDLVDISDELRGLSPSERSEALGYIRGLKSKRAS